MSSYRGNSKGTAKGAFFSSSNKRGEVNEWKEQLNHEKESARKEAVKKIIAAMTDVSMLFPDVVKSIQTNNIELKKLVYLYIMNYAKTQPDLAILAVNTFVQDSQHENPLIRGLAVRTMSCIRVNKIVEYLAEPLRRCIKDRDPYVRKTAAVAIAKLFDLSPEMAVDQGFIEALQELLTDQNPMVVANAVATLSEISANSPEVILDFTQRSVKTLLAALNECTEWGQVFILDTMAQYEPKDEREATQIAERVTPRLQHVNSAVVLGAVKVIMRMMLFVHDNEASQEFIKKLSSPLVTLLNTQPENQYVALRNINLIAQKQPSILSKDIKMFFCKYNDTIYVKLEKLEIMIMLVNDRNVDTVLMEFKEYATEVDVEFVRRSVRAIGRCAIKLERAAQRCIDALLDLIQTKVNYVVQEAIIVIKDIFRKYPNRYESIIGVLCENLDTLDEPEAKASMIWIIGEYAERIENADELLEVFLDTFHDETANVQLQLLTAIVKLFLKRPTDTQELVQKVLAKSTDESDNPDLRDRGYVYWRLLASDAAAAKDVVLSERPTINDDSSKLDEKLLNQLIGYIGTLSSIYHKPPELFVPDYKKRKADAMRMLQQLNEESQQDREDDMAMFEEQGRSDDYTGGAATSAPVPTGLEDDLLGLDLNDNNGRATAAPSGGGGGGDISSFDDFLAPEVSTSAPTPAASSVYVPESHVLLTPDPSKGSTLQLSGTMRREQGQPVYDLQFENMGSASLTGFAAKFNKNSFSLAPAGVPQIQELHPGQSQRVQLPLTFNGQDSGVLNNTLQVAMKHNIAGDPRNVVGYFADTIPLTVLLEDASGGRIAQDVFLAVWQSIAEEHSFKIPQLSTTDVSAIIQRLGSANIHYIDKAVEANQTFYYFSSKLLHRGQEIVIAHELVITSGSAAAGYCIKCGDNAVPTLLQQEVLNIL